MFFVVINPMESNLQKITEKQIQALIHLLILGTPFWDLATVGKYDIDCLGMIERLCKVGPCFLPC